MNEAATRAVVGEAAYAAMRAHVESLQPNANEAKGAEENDEKKARETTPEPRGRPFRRALRGPRGGAIAGGGGARAAGPGGRRGVGALSARAAPRAGGDLGARPGENEHLNTLLPKVNTYLNESHLLTFFAGHDVELEPVPVAA